MQQAVIVSGARTAVGRSGKGTLQHVRPDDMAAETVKEIVKRTPGLDPAVIEDVIIGTAMPEREQGFNLARIVTLQAGLPVTVPAVTVNRFCSTGLQTIAQGAERIMAGGADVVLAGGVESMSYLPFDASLRIAPNPHLAEKNPDAYLSMGLTAENVAEQYKITREQSDDFSYESHQKAIVAIDAGKFKDEIFALKVQNNNGGVFDTDEGPRRDTTLERLANLKPVFKMGGQVTAGNSSQTSDGAAAVMLMSDSKAKEMNLKPIAIFKGFTVTGVEPGIMGIGPVKAIPKLLSRTKTKLKDVKIIELNEAFACQALAVMKELDLPKDKINVNGGAVALGHPLGCSGAKLTLSLIHELKRQGGGLGIVTMCIGGGMGAAGLFEVPSD